MPAPAVRAAAVIDDVAVMVPAVSVPIVAFAEVRVPVAVMSAVEMPPYRFALEVAVRDPIVAV